MRAEKFGITTSKELIEDKKKMRAMKFGLDQNSKNIKKQGSIRSVTYSNDEKMLKRLERFKTNTNKT
jgi:hypothetical protein